MVNKPPVGIKMKSQHKKNNLFSALSIWVIGWSIFNLIEIIMRVITGPLARADNSTFVFMALLSFVSYISFGIITGVILHSIIRVLSERWFPRLRSTRLDCFHIASSIVVMIFLHTILFIDEMFTDDFINYTTILFHSGLLSLCLIVFLISYRAFASIQDKSKMMINYFALIVSLNLFMEFGLYRDQSLIPMNIRITAITDYAILFIVSIAFYLLARSLLSLIINYFTKNHFTRAFKAVAIPLAIMAILGISLILINRKISLTLLSNNAGTMVDNKINIILVVMDTTRRDHLSCYGYERKTTPNLDELVKESLLFTNAYSPSPWTLPSHASIMTSLYPSSHGSHYNVNSSSTPAVSTLDDSNITLAEILSQNEYKTAGVVGATFCHSFFGLAQGFDYYNDDFGMIDHDLNHYSVFRIVTLLFPLNKFLIHHSYHGIRRASELNKIVFPWLKKNNRHPFFLFINYFDAHWPYSPPPPYDTLYKGKNQQLIIDNYGSDWNLYAAVINKNHDLTDKERAHLLSQYDGEIAYLDNHIGELLEELKSLNLYDESMIIITSDHGESFGEHNLMDHGRALYEELLHIPLIIKYPLSQKITGTFRSPVSLLDIMPTILSTVAISLPKNFQGKVVTKAHAHRKVFAEHYRDKLWIEKLGSRFDRDLLAVYSGDFKYIWASNEKHELYNVKEDPQESHNLIHEMHEIIADMEKELQSRLIPFKSSRSINEPPQVDSTIREKLRALGYL